LKKKKPEVGIGRRATSRVFAVKKPMIEFEKKLEREWKYKKESQEPVRFLEKDKAILREKLGRKTLTQDLERN